MKMNDYLMNNIHYMDVWIKQGFDNRLLSDNTLYYDLWNDTTCSFGWGIIKNWIDEFFRNHFVHQHPKIYSSELVYGCAKRLCEIFQYEHMIYCSSGSLAVETAIKLARYKHMVKNKKWIVSLPLNFHGRTYGTMPISDAIGYEAPYHWEGFVPGMDDNWGNGYGILDSTSLEPDKFSLSVGKFCRHNSISYKHDIAAIITAPINGHNKVMEYGGELLQEIKRFCKINDITLIFDEVQSGFGLTGDWSAYQYYEKNNFDIKPDILILGKRMAAGFPMAAVLANKQYDFQPGAHFDTFAGSPFVAFLCLKVMDWLEKNMGRINYLGKYIEEKLYKFPFIERINRVGFMIAYELKKDFMDAYRWSEECKKKGILFPQFRKDGPIRFQPPFTISKTELDEIFHTFGQIYRESL